MNAAEFESMKAPKGEIQYPFSCFLIESNGLEQRYPYHWHYFIELIYLMQGELSVQIGLDTIYAKKGDLVLINGQAPHSMHISQNTRTEYIVLKFDPEVLYNNTWNFLEYRYILPFTNEDYHIKKFFSREQLINTNLPDMFLLALEESKQQKFGFELAIKTSISTIFLWILRNNDIDNGANISLRNLNNENVMLLQKLLDFTEENFSSDISTKDAAIICAMSYSYFSRYFKKYMKKTYRDYLNFVRISQAERLLLSSNMNVSEVAYSVGFSSSSYFIKQFKAIKGISPKQAKLLFLGDPY